MKSFYLLILLLIFIITGCINENYSTKPIASRMTYDDAHVEFEDIELIPLDVSGKYNELYQKKANCVIDLSNQDFDNTDVVLKVYFDEILILDKNCNVGNQHFFYRYYYSTSGEHTIKVVADDGSESAITVDFDVNSLNYLGISYWGESIDIRLFDDEIHYSFYIDGEEHTIWLNL